jgi:hypothetical protein
LMGASSMSPPGDSSSGDVRESMPGPASAYAGDVSPLPAFAWSGNGLLSW